MLGGKTANRSLTKFSEPTEEPENLQLRWKHENPLRLMFQGFWKLNYLEKLNSGHGIVGMAHARFYLCLWIPIWGIQGPLSRLKSPEICCFTNSTRAFSALWQGKNFVVAPKWHSHFRKWPKTTYLLSGDKGHRNDDSWCDTRETQEIALPRKTTAKKWKKISRGHSNYDAGKGGSQLTLLQSDKAHVGRRSGSTKHWYFITEDFCSFCFLPTVNVAFFSTTTKLPWP